jgi:exodeoxyribonuclease VII small subunit
MAEVKKSKNFELTLDKLEQIVGELEKGDLSLDKSIKKFESGIEMYSDCKEFLTDAENKIKILTDSLKEEDYLE